VTQPEPAGEPADDPAAAPAAGATPAAQTGPEARRRARAYLDLWERQLTHAAAEGPLAPPPRRPATEGT
jgi:hypothetical protein